MSNMFSAWSDPFARCIFGYSLATEWVSSWLLKTWTADVNRFIMLLNALVAKSLLVLRLRAIWNKDFIGEKARKMLLIDLSYWFSWILVTLILFFMTAGMFCRILFLIDDWWLKLVEVLVGFKDSIILNPPTEHIFQSAISVVIFGIYVESVFGPLLPVHDCWMNETHLRTYVGLNIAL